jgi:hypothetical protein
MDLERAVVSRLEGATFDRHLRAGVGDDSYLA